MGLSRASRMLRGETQPVRMPCVCVHVCVCVCENFFQRLVLIALTQSAP